MKQKCVPLLTTLIFYACFSFSCISVATPTPTVDPDPTIITDVTPTITAVITSTPSPTLLPSPTAHNIINKPAIIRGPMATLPKPDPSVEDSALIFLIDNSKSVAEYCQRQVEYDARYQIPDLFISFMSIYSNDPERVYKGPRMDWFVYPPDDGDRYDSNNDNLTNYDVLRNKTPQDLSLFVNRAWFNELESQLETPIIGIGHSNTLTATISYINSAPKELSHFVVVMITDGIIEYVPDQYWQKALTERVAIETAINNLRTIPQRNVDIIVLQLPCDLPDGGENTALEEDNRIVWDHLNNSQKITLIREDSVSAFADALFETQSFSNLLPGLSSSTGWAFFNGESFPIIYTPTVEDWFIWPEVVSIDALKANASGGDISFTLEGPQYTYDLEQKGLVFKPLGERPIKKFPPPDCHNSQEWELTGPAMISGFFLWKTAFPLQPRIESIMGEEGDGYLLNNGSMTITTYVIDEDTDPALLQVYKGQNCYTLRLVIEGEQDNAIYGTEKQLSEIDFNQQTWVVDTTEYRPLTFGPQNLEVYLQVVRLPKQDSVTELAVTEMSASLTARFAPEPAGQYTIACHNNLCDLTIPVQYIQSELYAGMEIPVEVFGLTDMSNDSIFIEEACLVTDEQPINPTAYSLFINGQYQSEWTLLQLAHRYVSTDINGYLVRIAYRWIYPACGYRELIVRWPSIPEYGERIVVCDLQSVTKTIEENQNPNELLDGICRLASEYSFVAVGEP
jgi:hypothetical protein